MDGYELADYAVRSETRHEHLAELRRLYGFRAFSGRAARELGDWLREEAPLARSNEDLARRFVDACRRTRTILPTTTTIERLCADAMVNAERQIEVRIAERVPPGLRRELEHLLDETVDAGVTRFVWLRQFEPGRNSADANRLLDRLEHLRRLDFAEGLFHDVPAHRITRLRRQGIRDFHAKLLRIQPVTRTAPEPLPQPFPQRLERASFSTQPGRRGHDSTSPVSTACCRPAPVTNLRCSRPSARQPVRSRTVARATAAARVDVLTEPETVCGRPHALSGGVRRNPRAN